MKKQILFAIFIGCCFAASFAQNVSEKRNLSDVSESLSKTTITFRYLDDEPQVVDSNDNLNKTVAILRANPNLNLLVEGYAGDAFDEPACEALAQKRADKVRELFIQKGLNQDQIESVSKITIDSNTGQAITNSDKEEHRSAIFRIVKREGKESTVSDEILNVSKVKIFFKRNKDIPIIKDQGDNIDKAVAILKVNPGLKLIVEGYTSDRGSEQHNRDLAQRRANNVRKLFIEKGVDPSQIETASYTVNDPQNRQNTADHRPKEHDCAIFRIVKR